MINVAPKGAQILPIGVNVNPAVVLINPQGLAVWVSAFPPFLRCKSYVGMLSTLLSVTYRPTLLSKHSHKDMLKLKRLCAVSCGRIL